MVKNRFYSYIKRVILGQENPYQKIALPKHANQHMD